MSKKAEVLKNEARLIFRNLLGLPKDSEDVDRFVDCLIGAAILEVAELQSKAILGLTLKGRE